MFCRVGGVRLMGELRVVGVVKVGGDWGSGRGQSGTVLDEGILNTDISIFITLDTF